MLGGEDVAGDVGGGVVGGVEGLWWRLVGLQREMAGGAGGGRGLPVASFPWPRCTIRKMS